MSAERRLEGGMQLRLLPAPTAPVYPEPRKQIDRLAQAFVLSVLTLLEKGGVFRSPVAVTTARHKGWIILSSAEGATMVKQAVWDRVSCYWLKVELARKNREPVEWFGVSP